MDAFLSPGSSAITAVKLFHQQFRTSYLGFIRNGGFWMFTFIICVLEDLTSFWTWWGWNSHTVARDEGISIFFKLTTLFFNKCFVFPEGFHIDFSVQYVNQYSIYYALYCKKRTDLKQGKISVEYLLWDTWLFSVALLTNHSY